MRSNIIGFVIGVFVLQQQSNLLPPYLYIGLLILILCFYSVRNTSFFLKIPLYFLRTIYALNAILFGFCWAGIFAGYFMFYELPKELEGKDIHVVGIIENLPINNQYGSKFIFQIEKVYSQQNNQNIELAKIPKRVSLSWNTSEDLVAELRPGQRWQLNVNLKQAHGQVNPNGFDYELWLFEQKIRATGSVKQNANVLSKIPHKLVDEFVWSVSSVIERARYKLRDRIYSLLPNKKYAGVIVALVIGDQRSVSQSDWQIFNRTGIGHLVSISGLHITMISGMFSALFFYLWRHSFFTNKQLPLLIPAQKIAAIAGVVAALIYVSLAGFGVPAQRTLLMLIVIAFAMWTGRIVSASHVLCLALGVVVAVDPWSVLWPGFWLSFCAVAILIFVNVGIHSLNTQRTEVRLSQRILLKLKAASAVQMAITIGLLPFSLLLFSQVSLISPFANAIAIPLISFFVTPLSLIGSVLPDPLSTWALEMAHFLMDFLAQILYQLSVFTYATWKAPQPQLWMFIIAIIGTIYLLAPKGWPMRYVGLICWLPIFFQVSTHPEKNTFQVTAFDVGQGSALLIETNQHRLLYDTGPSYSEESNGGTRILLPYLHSRGIDKLDVLLISHSDQDHSGGALSILENINIKKTISSLHYEHEIVKKSQHSSRCYAGQNWMWDGIHFEILQPAPASYMSSKWKPNARSCVLKVSTQYQSILIAGDIEATQEDEMLNMIPDKLRSTVLIVPHHGSGTSSTLPFLNQVQPELAIFQVGYQNRYKHPKQSVWQRYLDLEILSLRTDKSGAITLQFSSEKNVPIKRSEHRKVKSRYWQHKYEF